MDDNKRCEFPRCVCPPDQLGDVKCQYAIDVGMPEYRCVETCQYSKLVTDDNSDLPVGIVAWSVIAILIIALVMGWLA